MNNQNIKIKQVDSIVLKQHNTITGAREYMSSIEKNIVYMLMSQLRDDDPRNKIYEIHVKDLERLTNSQPSYSYLRVIARKMIGCVYSFYMSEEFIQLPLLSAAKYKKGTGIIELEISNKIRPFFFDLKNNYTLFQFRAVIRLKSKYSKKIYEMLNQFKNTGIFRIPVHELKERFGLIDPKTGKENSYSDFNLFATKVLEVAKKEINELTDIKFEYKTKKTGRKVTDLEFFITQEAISQRKAFIESNKREKKLSIQEHNTENQSYNLEGETLKQYLYLTKESRWLDKKLAFVVVKNIPTQNLWDYIHRVQIAIQKGGVEKKNIVAHFNQILNPRMQQQDEFKFEEIKSIYEQKHPESSFILPGYYYQKLVIEYGIEILTVSQIASKIDTQLLKAILNKIFQEITEKKVPNKKEYILFRLNEELREK